MKEVFISRKLAADSPFRQALAALPLHIQDFSLLRLEAVGFEEVPACDWIFFYSRHAVTFFFQRVMKLQWPAAAGIRYAAIGMTTAKAIESFIPAVDFTGDGDPDSTAAMFGPLAKGKRVLFPRAALSRQSIQKQLSAEMEIIDLIVYTNGIDPEQNPPPADILVFTSPLNVQAYYRKQPLRPDQRVVAIGRTTAGELRKIGVEAVRLAAEPSEEAMARVVMEIWEGQGT